MNRRTLLLGSAATILVGGAVWMGLQDRASQGSNLLVGMAEAQTTGDPSAIPDMVLGNPDAAVEVIEYASYTCPHCANFHASAWPQLKADYIDTGKIKFVYREVYFDRFGLWASMIARCGGEMRFWGITDLIYERQREWIAGGSDPALIVENLRKIGKTAGLDDAALDACMSDGETAQNLVAWYESNSKADGITGTPSFIINGEKYSNMPWDEFKALLDGLLEA